MLLQAQLLRAVQEKVFKRVGGNSWQQADFRLVCATNRDLLQEVGSGGFRADLYYRLATFVFRTIPLHERRDDIVPLARYFLNTVMADSVEFDSQVIDYLNHREYPGNVRDLRQLITRIAYRMQDRADIGWRFAS